MTVPNLFKLLKSHFCLYLPHIKIPLLIFSTILLNDSDSIKHTQIDLGRALRLSGQISSARSLLEEAVFNLRILEDSSEECDLEEVCGLLSGSCGILFSGIPDTILMVCDQFT